MRTSTAATLALVASIWLCSSCAEHTAAALKQPLATRQGLASYYGRAFEGKTTASGRTFDPDHLVAAHPSWPFGTRVRVTSLDNGRSVIVRVIDRGPTRKYVRQGVIIDLSKGAARKLGFVRDGREPVRLEVLQWGNNERVRGSRSG